MIRKGNIYKYQYKGKDLDTYCNIEVCNNDVIFWCKDIIKISKGDTVILTIKRKKDILCQKKKM